MLQTLLEFVNANLKLVSLIASLFIWLVGLFSTKSWERIKKEWLIHGLRLKRNRRCRIVLPIYKQVDLYPDNRKRKKFDMIEKEDALALLNISALIQKMGLSLEQDYFLHQDQNNLTYESYNVFCIGGIVANKQTAYYFSRLFNDFRIYKKKIDEEDQNEKKIFLVHDTKRGFCWGQGKEYLVGSEEDYAILVRLTSKDINVDGSGTVYILYGNNTNSTLAVSKYLLCHTEDLIKRTKKNNHFFIVFKVRESDGMLHLDFEECQDLTDEMFTKK